MHIPYFDMWSKHFKYNAQWLWSLRWKAYIYNKSNFCHQSQINATHNNSFKTRQKHRILYQLMQKKFPSSTKKSCHAYWPLLGLYLFEGVFYAIYTIKSQSSTVIQTCYTVAQPQQTRVISLYRDYCTKLSQSLDGMWSILNMFQLVQRIPNKPTIFLLSAIGCILITKS